MMMINIKDENTGADKQVSFRFYRRTIFSAILMATADPLTFTFFDGTTDDVRNYVMRQNFFDSGRGRVGAMRSKILGPAMGRLTYSAAELDAIVLVSQQMSMNMKLDTDTVENPMMAELMPSYDAYALIATVSVAPNEIGPLSQENVRKVGIYWKPPIWVDLGKTTTYETSGPRFVAAPVTIPAALNTYFIETILALEELPGGNPVQART